MTSKEKVFIILSPGFPASEADTTCLPMQQRFVKSFSTLYPSIKLIVLSFHYPFLKKTYRWFDVSVICFNGRNRGGLTRIFLRRRVVKTLQKIHKEKQVVGLLSFWLGECAFVGKKFADKNGLMHYTWLLGQDAKPGNRYALNLSVKANELIALSDFLQLEFERNYGVRPFSVITPGVDEKPLNQQERDIDLLGVGSLIPLKQFEIFLEIVAIVKTQIPKIKAVLIGDGPQKNKLETIVSTLGLENNICFMGNIDNDRVMETMQKAKILIHPSTYEGFSGVCQEALANGAHVISFCRAMNTDIEQWHIVKTKQEIVKKAIAILADESVTYRQVNIQPMKATASQMMNCYV